MKRDLQIPKPDVGPGWDEKAEALWRAISDKERLAFVHLMSLTLREVAHETPIPLNWLRRCVRYGLVPAFKFKGRYRIWEHDIPEVRETKWCILMGELRGHWPEPRDE